VAQDITVVPSTDLPQPQVMAVPMLSLKSGKMKVALSIRHPEQLYLVNQGAAEAAHALRPSI
jgi:hypothetical protein